MRKSIYTFLLSATILFTFHSTFAQGICNEVTATAGSSESDATAYVAWSIGEVVSESILGNNRKVTQGFHQTLFCIDVGLAEISGPGFGLDMNLYPNPFTEMLVLDFSNLKSGKINITLTDIQGKILLYEEHQMDPASPETKIRFDLSGYAAALYMLNVSDGISVQSYKLTKID